MIKNKLKKIIPIRIKLLLFKLFFRYLHFNEVKLIFLFLKKNTKGLMIDVGAHRGTSSKFNINGWGNIIAFKNIQDAENFYAYAKKTIK